jgi:hypothetical protein
MKNHLPTAEQLKLDWANNPRWAGITRAYSAEDVVRLRGTVHVEHSIARLGAEKLWKSLQTEDFVNALGALTGNQAMQQVKAGLKAIYLRAGRSPPTPTWPARCIPTSRCTRPTRCRRWSSASTTPCCAPTSSTMPRAMIPSTSCSRSWPMPKPVSAAC